MKLHTPTRHVSILLTAALLLLFACAIPASAARDPLVRVEPPSPYLGKSWKDVRQEQITFAQRLALWGIDVEATPNARSIDDAARETKIEMKWTSADQVAFTISVRSPKSIAGYDFVGDYTFSATPTDTSQSASGGLGFGEGKVSGEIITATDTPLASKITGEFQRGFARLKVATGTQGSSYELGLDFGVAKVKLDPVKYFQRFISFVPRFIDASRQPADAALDELTSVNFNPGLIAAALTNDVTLWLRQMETEKAAIKTIQENLSNSFIQPTAEEVAFRRQQSREAVAALQQVAQQNQTDARLAATAQAAQAEFLQKARYASRPLPPPQPEQIDSYAGTDAYSSGSSAREQREPYSPPSRQFEFHSPTLNYAQSGAFGHGM